MRSSPRWFGRFVMSVIFACLAFDATTMMAQVPKAFTPKPGHGVVVVSLTGNTARTGQFTSLEVQRAAAPGQSARRYSLDQVSAGLSRDTSLFIGSLPPGNYSFTKLSTLQQFVALNAGGQRLLGGFIVEEGVTVDLGRLVLTALNTGVILGRSAKITDNLELIRSMAPEHMTLLETQTAPGWIQPRSPEDKVEDYAQATPVGADSLTELSDGHVVACSRLGMILVRRPIGRWAFLPTGQLSSMLWLVALDGTKDRLAAVGEFNTIVRVDHEWKVTPMSPGNLPPGNLFFIDGNDQQGWVVGHQYRKTVLFLQSSKLDGGEWKVLKQEVLKDSFWSGSDRVWAWRTSKGFAYAQTMGGMHAFDRETGTWSPLELPKGGHVTAVSTADRWAVLVSPGGGFGGPFSTTLVSSDEGRTWTEIKRPSGGGRMVPCLLPGGSMLLVGGRISKPEIFQSADGGRTWISMSQEKVTEPIQLVATPGQGVFAIEDGGTTFGLASIANSKDEGKNWISEYSNFNRAAYEQKKP